MAAAPHIEIILDRSGSMGMSQGSTIEGFNKFVLEQPKSSRLWLTQFDTGDPDLRTYKGIKVRDARLTVKNYEPRGGTPLYDAIGNVVTRLLKAPPKGRTTVLIITDGYNNASRDFDRAKVAALIKKAQKKHDWQFVFMGADIDAYSAGAAIGLSGSQTFAYASIHTDNTWANVTRGSSRYNSGISASLDTTDWEGGTSGVEQEVVDLGIDPLAAGTIDPIGLTTPGPALEPDLNKPTTSTTSEDTPPYLR